METITLYTIACIVMAVMLLTGSGIGLHIWESRKLKQVLKHGREYEALILNATAITPSLFRTENIRLKVQILAEKPLVTEFNYSASYAEQRELVTGKIITVDIDPADRRNVMITRKASRIGDALLAV